MRNMLLGAVGAICLLASPAMAKTTIAVSMAHFDTVFQDARGQGKGLVDAATALAKGDKVESIVWVPFQLVSKSNYKDFTAK